MNNNTVKSKVIDDISISNGNAVTNFLKKKYVESDAIIRAKHKYKYKDIEKFRQDNKVHCKNYYLNLSQEKKEIGRIKAYEYYLKVKDTPEYKQKCKDKWLKKKYILLI
jgi:hypothetical protein